MVQSRPTRPPLLLVLLSLTPMVLQGAPPNMEDIMDPLQDLYEDVGSTVSYPAVTDVTHPRCSDYICGIEMCLPIDDCDGVVRQNATECGCCPLCIQYLDEGRACGRHGVLRFPEEPTTMCRPPLECIDGYCASPDASRPPPRSPRKQKPLPSAIESLKVVLFGPH